MNIRLAGALGATAVAALLAASPALADPSGFVSISAGPLNYGFDGFGSSDSIDGWSAQGAASGVYMFTPVLGAQGDIVVNFDRLEESGDSLEHTALDGALHGFYREADKFLVGGFVQLGHDTYDSNSGSDTLDGDRAYVGGEAQVFFENATLYAQAGMQRLTMSAFGAPFDFNLDGWFGNLEGRYFLTPDFRIEAHVGFSTLDLPFLGGGPGVPDRMDTVNLGLGAEYKFENLPVSVFASYDYSTSSYNVADAPSINTHRVLVGVKFALGEETLLDRDRNGASLKPVQSLFGTGTIGF